MRRRTGRTALRSAALALGMIGLLGSPPLGATEAGRPVAVHNRGHQAITELYVSPSDADDWGDDRLSGVRLPAGGVAALSIPASAGCLVDIQVIYADRGHEERRGVDLCRAGEVTFDGSTASRTAPGGQHDATVVDRSPLPIVALYLSDPGADDWGDDRLAGRVLAPGASVDIHYHGTCHADLRVVFDNLAAEERRDLAICGAPLVVTPGWTTRRQAGGSLHIPERMSGIPQADGTIPRDP
jgi:hypothetical protein